MVRTFDWHGFRGSIAPASLKPESDGPCVFGVDLFPGLYCPGLIEARKSRSATRLATPFPGLYCPGLIEARGAPPRPTHRPARFRGSIAPASLKPGLPGHLPGRQLGFRGSIAPASLKREAIGGARAENGSFRGSIAPASLKREFVLRLGHRVLRFRGSIAPASLKRRRLQHRDGLPGVSGALLPRPH